LLERANARLSAPMSMHGQGDQPVHHKSEWTVKACYLEELAAALEGNEEVHSFEVLEDNGEEASIRIHAETQVEDYHCLASSGEGLGECEVYAVFKPCKKSLRAVSDLHKAGARIVKTHEHKKKRSALGLTGAQWSALWLAVHYGYYSWPKKITLEELASKSGVSRISFQERLRKAEEKALPKLLGPVFRREMKKG